MVKSRIEENINYDETEGIDNLLFQLDNLVEYNYPLLYFLSSDKNKDKPYSKILLGVGKIDYKIISFPIYLLNNESNIYDLCYPQIGLFEIKKELYRDGIKLKLITETGHLDLVEYWKYCFDKKIDHYKPLFFETIINEEIISNVISNTFQPKCPNTLETNLSNIETKKTSAFSVRSSSSEVSMSNKWLKFLFKDSDNVKIIETKFDGNCFFDALAKSNINKFGSRTNDEKIKLYREIVSNNVTELSFTNRKNLFNLIEKNIKELDIKQQEIKTLIRKGNNAGEDVTKLNNNLRELETFQRENQENLSYVYDVRNINTFENYKQFIKTKDWWADESAIAILEKELNVKFIIISSNYIKDYLLQGKKNIDLLKDIQSHLIVNPVNCSTSSNESISYNWKPDHYIMLEHNSNHYKLIEYNSKRKLDYSEIPDIIKSIILNFCVRRQITGKEEDTFLNNFEKIEDFINEKFGMKK